MSDTRRRAVKATRSNHVNAGGRRLALGAAVLGLLAHGPAALALNLTRCVSDDNHVYIVITTNAIATEVTSLALTTASANACAESPASMTVVTALAAGQGGPLPNRQRTTVLTGLFHNAVSCEGNFDAAGGGGAGVMTLPNGSKVSVDPASTTVPLVPITTADARVPAAVEIASVSRSFSGCAVSGGTTAFPSGPGIVQSDVNVGEQGGQTITFDDTLLSKVGNAPPGNSVAPTQAAPDGFLLRGNCTNPATCEAIVFVANEDGAPAFGAAVAGFSVSTSMMTMSTESAAQNRDFNAATPTRTPTVTASPTSTPTATPTPVCGDGVRQGQEQCDDGNNVAGDCCSPDCHFESAGSPCPDDGNVCTGDECDGQGHCLHDIMLDGELCDDGNLCTGADLCAAGDCVGGSDVSCDDHDRCTADACDPHKGCTHTVVVESPDCGTCNDCIDNDGDGLVDGEDPDCSDFPLFQRFAVVGTVPSGKMVSVRLGKNTQILGEPTSCPPPVDARGAGACAMEVFTSTGVNVTGSMAAIGRSRFSGGLPHSWIKDEYCNKDGAGAIKTGHFKPFVGPAIYCSDGTTPCHTDLDCTPPDVCDVGRDLTDPANPFVNLTGNAAELQECADTQSQVSQVAMDLEMLPVDEERGKVRLKSTSPPLVIDITGKGPGPYVIAFDELRTSRAREIILKGNADQVLVLRDRGRFKLGTRGEVRVDGGLTQNHVIWVFEGDTGLVKVGAYADMDGTMIAPARRRISLGTFTTLDGAAYGLRVRLGRAAIVRHFPFAAKITP